MSIGGEWPPDRRKAAGRAALHGPAPADRELRDNALELANRHLASASGRRFVVQAAIFGAVGLLELGVFLTGGRWFYFSAAAFFFGLLALTFWDRRRWQRRVAVLSPGHEGQDSTSPSR